MEPMPTRMSQGEHRSRPDDFLAALNSLRRGELRGLRLEAFSDLDREEIRLFRETWDTLTEPVRADVVRRIGGATEDRFDLTFGRVLRLALRDRSAAVRQLAVAGLWDDERTDLVPTFLNLLLSDTSTDVRSEAARALGLFTAMASEGDLDPAVAENLREAMVRLALEDDVPYTVHRRLIESIGSLAEDSRASSVIEAAYHSGDDGLQASALFAMGRSHAPRWAELVLAQLHNSEAEIRLEAVRSAGALGDERATPILAEIAGDDEVEIRLAAVSALGQIGGRMAVGFLRRLRESADHHETDLYDEAISEGLDAVGEPAILG